jgi:glutathione S-transferase
MTSLTLYGDSISGNCLKPKWTADLLGIALDWRETSVVAGETRRPEFLSLNPWGQVPLAVFADGRALPQSNAIMLHLAEGSRLIPQDAFERAQMFAWLFWEQYSHETSIAVRRFRVAFQKLPEAEIEPHLKPKGDAALAHMEASLEGRRYFVGDALSCADIALVAYTRWAPDGGFDLGPLPNVRGWIARVERDLGLPETVAAA